MSDCLFYIFAAIAVAAATLMVASRNTVTGALGMIAALVAVAADYFLLDAPFLGVLQVLVYAGAVMVLFLFIIMLLDVDKTSHERRSAAKWVLGAIVLGATVGAITYALTHADLGAAKAAAEAAPATGTEALAAPLPHGTTAKVFGYGLFTKYMLPLQLAGFLLLSAMIGVVTLVRRPKE